MSTLFGVPPPPENNIFEPGYGPTGPIEDDEVRYLPEPDPWRRRAAILLAFLTVGTLMFANLATWAHFRAVPPSRAAGAVSTSTLREATPLLVAKVDAAIIGQLPASVTQDRTPTPPAAAGATVGSSPTPTAAPTTPVDPTVARRVDTAVRTALAQPAFKAVWTTAIADTLQRQRAIGKGSEPQAFEVDGASFDVLTSPLVASIEPSLARVGITVPAATPLVLPPFTIATTASTAQYRSAYRVSDSLWWLLVLLAIGLGTATILVATQRIRMGVVLCIDAAVVLAGSLLLVPAVGQTVDDQAIDPAQSAVLVAGYDALTSSLVVQTVVLIVLAVLTACGLGIVAWGRRRESARALAA